MHIFERAWTTITYVVSFFSFSGVEDHGLQPQAPLFTNAPETSPHVLADGPLFPPPPGLDNPVRSDITCNYTAMGPDWESCSTPENRTCWLKNKRTGVRFDIGTDYESQMPMGVNREYTLDLVNGSILADGLPFTEAKYFQDPQRPAKSDRDKFPGPWIQACWGDNITVTVRNFLPFNGTSVHWHGIRQLNTTHMDGVNGLTQCPIAPKDNFTYSFVARQYGTSWYHSHYSVQYADGAAGPMTIHGPTSEKQWDETVFPILMTDWGHNSAFAAITAGLDNPSILLNGIGNAERYNNNVIPKPAPGTIPQPYTISFERTLGGTPKRYLLRLINTSFDSTFVFSIDNHNLTVISTDFVPIEPYITTNVVVGIGQRYNVVVTAKPINHRPGNPLNFWIRTWKEDCFLFSNPPNNTKVSLGYERTGILRYRDSDFREPVSNAWPIPSLNCTDEPFDKLKPVLKWNVSKTAANDPRGNVGENLTVIGFNRDPSLYPLASFSMGLKEDFNPLYIDYGNPTFLNLNYTGDWNPEWVVIPENYTAKDWVYLAIKGRPSERAGKKSPQGAHPIHLHGHDFAILQQNYNTTFPAGLALKYDNPPRRDVVLLPTGGYVVIAFKADNPGPWLMHCHIATHAGFGLGLQVLERQKDAIGIWPRVDVGHALLNAQNTCNNWNNWWGNCNNWWPGNGSMCRYGGKGFAPDSGI